MASQDKNEAIDAFLADKEKARYLRPEQVGPLAAGLPGFGDEKIEEIGMEKVWVPDDDTGYAMASVRAKKDASWEVEYLNEDREKVEKDVPLNQLQEVNPKAFHLSENMASLTHLNEASVLYNLRERFGLNLIHTYSGLFCVTINPWRWLPIYTPDLIDIYCGQADNRPPHVYQVANTAYSNVIEGAGNQSILITGESGAGKTENTKKIIQYFTVVAGRPRSEGESSLEDQIVEMNPVLEAFGNAKTVKNDNSSRFGKFIRIRFGQDAKINGADVQSYLLEKSRVVSQNPNERNYHIFYQLLSPHGLDKDTKEKMGLKLTPDDYRFTSQGDASKVRGMDDSIEMKHTHRAMKLLGFNDDECVDIYSLVYSVLLIGQMKFVQQDGSQQTFIDGYEEANLVCDALGLSRAKFINSITDPTFMVGGEVMTKYLDYKATMFCIAAFAKVVYQKIFDMIIKRCNKCLNEKHQKDQMDIETATEDGAMFRKNKRKGDLFIGVLDIAGFEIMPINSFEQLCINFTNEKLQQFFNHYMFVREQKEYEQEKIEWDRIDFGLDLEHCINLLERPLGVLSMLEEEGMVPNGSDADFVAKLLRQHQDKTPRFKKPKISRKTTVEAHFAVEHYAGTVPYVVDGWLDKNKDPINDCLVDLVKLSATNDLLRTLFGGPADIKDAAKIKAAQAAKGKKKSGKSSSLMTTTVVHKAQLNDLLVTLNRTSPHFVRCLVPNYGKEPGWLNGPLVLHQLQCNGVLEGIRICRRGYPSRILFQDFCERYKLFATDLVNREINGDIRKCTGSLCEAMGLEPLAEYQLGVSKIFLRVGVIGRLESRRLARINQCLTGIQSHIRSWHVQVNRKQRSMQKTATEILHRVFHNYVKYLWDYNRRVLPWRRLVDLTKTIDLDWTEEDWEQVMGALEKSSEGDGGKWENGEWVAGKVIDGVFVETKKREKPEKGSKMGRRGMIHAAELDEMKEENEKLKMEVQYLTDKMQEVTTLCEEKDQEIVAAKNELQNHEQAVVELKSNVQEQEDNIKVLAQNLTVEKVVIKEMENKTDSLLKEIEETREQVRVEKRSKEAIEIKASDVQRKLDDTKYEIRKLEDEKRIAENAVSEKSVEMANLEAKLTIVTAKLEQAESNSKDYSGRLNQLQSNLDEEKAVRKKLEKTKESLVEDKRDLQQRCREMDKKIETQYTEIRNKTEELSRLNKQMDDAKHQFEMVVNDLKARHHKALTAVQNDKENFQKDKLRLELENRQLRGQLEAERSDKLERSSSGYFGYDRGYDADILGNTGSGIFAKRKFNKAVIQTLEVGLELRRYLRNRKKDNQLDVANCDRLPSNRISYRSYSSVSNSSTDDVPAVNVGASKSVGNMMSKRMEDLERENKILDNDKRQIKRELEKTKNELNDERDEKDLLKVNFRQSRHDADKLSAELIRQEEKSMELERQLHRAHNDILAWKTKFEQQSFERQNEMDKEKQKMKAKLDEAEEHDWNKSQQVNSMEKTRTELLHELMEVNTELQRSYQAMGELEKLQKTQDKALDHWSVQYKQTTSELEQLREENNRLRTKLRQQQKELESLKEACRGQGLRMEASASLLENDIRSLRNDIETSKPFSATIENGHVSASSTSTTTYDYNNTSSSTSTTGMRNGYDSYSVDAPQRRRDRSLSRERSPADFSASLSISSDYKPSATKPPSDVDSPPDYVASNHTHSPVETQPIIDTVAPHIDETNETQLITSSITDEPKEVNDFETKPETEPIPDEINTLPVETEQMPEIQSETPVEHEITEVKAAHADLSSDDAVIDVENTVETSDLQSIVPTEDVETPIVETLLEVDDSKVAAFEPLDTPVAENNENSTSEVIKEQFSDVVTEFGSESQAVVLDTAAAERNDNSSVQTTGGEASTDWSTWWGKSSDD